MNAKQKTALGLILLVAGLCLAVYCTSEMDAYSVRYRGGWGWWGSGGYEVRHGGTGLLSLGKLLGFVMTIGGFVLTAIGVLEQLRTPQPGVGAAPGPYGAYPPQPPPPPGGQFPQPPPAASGTPQPPPLPGSKGSGSGA